MLRHRPVLYYVLHMIAVISFYFAFTYEGARGNRYVTLLVLFGVYVLLTILLRRCKTDWAIFALLCLKIAIMLLIEMNSKYAVNYFVHAIYLSIIIEAIFYLPKTKNIIICTMVFLASMYKFVNLLMINPSFSNRSQMYLFALINIFIIVVMIFAKHHQEEKTKVDELYHKLLGAHEQLQQYADRIKSLTVVEERNRIARDLHDTLGHNLTGLIMQLEMTSTMMDEDMDVAKELMEQSKGTSRDSLKKVREIVEAFKEDSKVYTNLDEMHRLVHDFASKTGTDITLEITGEAEPLSPEVYITIYRIVQESMTNAVRHGRAEEVHVGIHQEEHMMTFHIEDNGSGCKKVIEGYGLRGMRERIELLGGSMSMSYSHKQGFSIEGSIPLAYEGVQPVV